MPGSSRRDIIREGEIATYHVWSQTALQRFLLGRDYDLKQNNEHRRAWCDSNSPILAMPLEQYLRLAEAAAERALKLLHSKSSRDSTLSTVSEDLAEILRNLGIHCEEWYATLETFHERFYYLVGTPEHVAEMVARRGKQRAFGMSACRKAFRDIPPSSGDETEASETAEKVPCGATRDSDSDSS